jgi:hypothetical protein
VRQNLEQIFLSVLSIDIHGAKTRFFSDTLGRLSIHFQESLSKMAPKKGKSGKKAFFLLACLRLFAVKNRHLKPSRNNNERKSS